MFINCTDKTGPKFSMEDTAKANLVRGLIATAGDKFFSVIFIKKNGEVRPMTARRGVTKGVKGTSKYDVKKVDQSHGLITVWDTGKQNFRKINLNTVIGFKVKGMTYNFLSDEDLQHIELQNLLTKLKVEVSVSVTTEEK